MRSALFWLAVAFFIGAVSHLSYVLIAPSFAMQRLIGTGQADTPVNRFVLLDAPEQMRLLGEAEGEAVSAKCLFDISKGELLVTAEMPDTFWSLTLYSDKGADLYTINDRQAGIDRFKLTVKRAPGIIDLLRGDQSETTRALSDGWSVEIPEPTGIAVFWMALDYPEQRKLFTDILSRSSCALTPEAS
ncbi:hypothetical protein [Taklimakanibacter deserti]|uniref:hypothetical protein n=1 Tax=Taklimakanibacter deserti TaxID=2267839 RepID=UPI0013C47F06